MKIKDTSKGIIEPELKIEDYIDKSVDEETALQELEADERKIRMANSVASHNWTTEGQKNLKIILKDREEIGRRISYLFEKLKVEKASLARQIGVGRTTIYRYSVGDTAPSKAKLLAILGALSISVADFCYEPNNFDLWKAALEETAAYERDIFDIKASVLGLFDKNDFTYRHNGELKRLPYQHYSLLKSLLENGFKVLELLPHDVSFFDKLEKLEKK